jgi:hypothetical protein
MQRKLQLQSDFRAFIIELSSFHNRTIKNDQLNEISNNYAQNSLRDEKEHLEFEKISD